jgi:hypothetical protein
MAIKTLKQIFDDIRSKTGKDIAHIFSTLVDDNQEIKVMGLVEKLLEMNVNYTREKLI